MPDFGKGFKLRDIDPGEKKVFRDRTEAEAEMAADIARIDELQDVLWAQARHAVMVVFQAMDAGGKDGTIKKVFGPVDPLGLTTTSFKKPTDKELAQDYLWRVHQAVPPRGMIGIFNRSHYEDVLIVRVHGLAPPEEIEQRYDQINAFEKHLAENGVTILKFFLHISKDEQKERLQDRINDPTKRWKFNPGGPQGAQAVGAVSWRPMSWRYPLQHALGALVRDPRRPQLVPQCAWWRASCARRWRGWT